MQEMKSAYAYPRERLKLVFFYREANLSWIYYVNDRIAHRAPPPLRAKCYRHYNPFTAIAAPVTFPLSRRMAGRSHFSIENCRGAVHNSLIKTAESRICGGPTKSWGAGNGPKKMAVSRAQNNARCVSPINDTFVECAGR